MTSRSSAIALVLLAVAFVFVPGMVAGDLGQDNLAEVFRKGFVGYWSSGAGLDGVVDYWFRYHVVKAVIAALLVIVLGVLLRQVTSRVAVVLVTLLGLLSLAALMANVQGMVAPLSSLLPMLQGAGPELADTLNEVRRRLAAGDHTPVLDVLVDDFARYHWAMAVIAGVVAVVFAGLSVWSWKRRVWGFGVLTTLLSAALIVVVVANTITAAHSAPALLALFEGGW
ncbi:hypothetical protein Lesp02_15100 [Lentzea sp. NBRC 105346]|uniref:hypothetical protein n=1 Tax=Lentzea sp. NBRC 105346 TaxID=3032205 RepID=UPI0024A47B77|nr:hypothetical protein [Lentzea sp. NBRC 105346]GLZ29320.1 hypothetical protein Lesp02_15100 [Lentzea sp. NBRC 105346]